MPAIWRLGLIKPCPPDLKKKSTQKINTKKENGMCDLKKINVSDLKIGSEE